MAAVMRVDDGHSDPVSIAYGVAPQCSAKYLAFSQEMMSGMWTEGGQAAMRNG